VFTHRRHRQRGTIRRRGTAHVRMRPARALREESERNAQFVQLPFSGTTYRPKLLVSDVFSHIAASPWSARSDAISAGSRPLGQHLL
jgi:hypothetical protein